MKKMITSTQVVQEHKEIAFNFDKDLPTKEVIFSSLIEQKEFIRAICSNDLPYILDLGVFWDKNLDINFEINKDGTTPLMFAC